MAQKILVVDDSVTVRQQVGSALSQAGFEIIEAADGEEGLSKITANPDLLMVITDVNMPRMNGLEMLEKLKANPKHSKLIVFMLTTEGQPELIDRAKKAGAKGWIVKPFKAELLVSAAKKLASMV
jgi:two-component system, chemotaxis family, chemotaxis protein CheY